MVGIVGQTGAGKTTIIKLILRFYDTVSGTIKIGSQNIKDIKLQNLRENIGYVSQDIFMFDGTVKDNIAYPNIDNNQDLIINAAKQRQAHEFIEKLPNGYDSMIGERGQKLSAGQKQRIAIARALILNPKLLILDEPTSALDVTIQGQILNLLNSLQNKYQLSYIFISHDMKIINSVADYVIVLKEGKIVEEGNTNSIFEKPRNNYTKELLQSVI